ncbi:TY-Chap domain-containing protein [Paenarthrobacter sp. NCHU4564]|uniref:TY-Chap domain-containing protein n=1 Tax=Paenarthrobacter sp. NCHU4564 TaxID=3451353 RepID=UPI003F94496C
MLASLGSRIAERGELARSRSLLARSRETANLLADQQETIQQLLTAGVHHSEIPKVLEALGSSVDKEISVELLCNHRWLANSSEWVSPPKPIALLDRLSLLYMAGVHLRIEPDYMAALANMPSDDVRVARDNLGSFLSNTRVAEILAVVQATSHKAQADELYGPSMTAYGETLEGLESPTGGSTTWPYQAQDLRRRVGNGSWEETLNAVGLSMNGAAARFEDLDFDAAARDFNDACSDPESPFFHKDVSTYDTWVINEAAAGRERPSPIEIRRHFNTWEEVISAAYFTDDDEISALSEDYRARNRLERKWAAAGEDLNEALAGLSDDWTLVIEHRKETLAGPPLQARARIIDGDLMCEIRPAYSLAGEISFDKEDMVRRGWRSADCTTSDLLNNLGNPSEAGHEILEALQHAFGLRTPAELHWQPARPDNERPY